MSDSDNTVQRLVATLSPERRAGVFVVSSIAEASDVPFENLEAMIREEEGVTVVVTEAVAKAHHLVSWFRAAWITLEVNSELTDVGLTAAVSKALTEAQISCNILAGARHDHILVPEAQADAAMRCLLELQKKAQEV